MSLRNGDQVQTFEVAITENGPQPARVALAPLPAPTVGAASAPTSTVPLKRATTKAATSKPSASTGADPTGVGATSSFD